MYDLVVSGKIVNPDKIFGGYIGINGDAIEAIRKYKLRGRRTIDASSCLIFPGLIDLHTHLREDGSHKWDYKEDFTSGTRAAIHGGVTTVVDMPNTPEPTVTLDKIKEKKRLAREKGKIEVLFYAGVTRDNIRQLKEMADEIIGYKIFTCESTGGLYLPYEFIKSATKQIIPTGKPISFHCEDQDINEEMKAKFSSYSSPEIHCEVRPALSEIRAVMKVVSLEIPNLNFCHVSLPKSMNIIKGYFNSSHTCEVTPHHLLFNRNYVKVKGNLIKSNPPVRDEEDRQALLETLKRGEIDFGASDHAPHSEKEKREDVWNAPSGIPSLDNTGNFISWLIVKQYVDPRIIARMYSFAPSRFLKLEDRGEIKVGNRANITILNTHKPEKITSDNLYTKGASPYVGMEFPGRVEYVIYKGEVIAENGEVLV